MPNQDEGKKDANEYSLLEQLPIELFKGPIAKYLSNADLWSLSQTSKMIFFKCCESLESRAVKLLVSYVIKGEEADALKMIDAKPSLLLRSQLIAPPPLDHSGRPYKGFTPFQVALLNHDMTLWKKMEHYFDKLPDGKTAKATQFEKIFPQGLPKQNPYDFKALVEVISASSDADIEAALKKESNGTPICQALENFRVTFTRLAMNETFFNRLHLIEAFLIYQDQFDTWSPKQRNLFWRQIIGYTQRFLPASYAQAFCQGLYAILVEEEMLTRSLNFRSDSASASYYPLSESAGLGYDFGIENGRAATEAELHFAELARPFNKLYEANKVELLSLESRMLPDSQSQSARPVTG